MLVGVGLSDAWQLVFYASIRHTWNTPMGLKAIGGALDDIERARNIADATDEVLWNRADALRMACLFTLVRAILPVLRRQLAATDADAMSGLQALLERATSLEHAWTRTPLRSAQTDDYKQGAAAELLGCDPDALALVRGGDA